MDFLFGNLANQLTPVAHGLHPRSREGANRNLRLVFLIRGAVKPGRHAAMRFTHR